MAKKDDRSNNVERLHDMVENTQHNIEEAKNTLANGELSEEQRQQIKQKNKNREMSIQAFQNEIADEKAFREGKNRSF